MPRTAAARDQPGDALTLHGTPASESALQLSQAPDGAWTARMTLAGMVASTVVDAHRAAELGWKVSESRIGAPPSRNTPVGAGGLGRSNGRGRASVTRKNVVTPTPTASVASTWRRSTRL